MFKYRYYTLVSSEPTELFNRIYIHMNVKKQKAGPGNKVYFQTNNCEKRTPREDSCLISTAQLNYFLKTGEESLTGLDFSNISEVLHYEFSCSNRRVISSLITCKIVELHLLNIKIYLYILESYKYKMKCQWKINSFS